MAPFVEPTFEDELGCSSYCSAQDLISIHIVDEEPDLLLSTREKIVAENHSPSALYFCLSPTCTVPSRSAADHQAVCQKTIHSSYNYTYCDDFHHFDMPANEHYPSEKFPAFDASFVPESDLEMQIFNQTQAVLPRPKSTRGCAGKYQATLWFLSNRPRDSLLVLFGSLIAFVATIMLLLLVFLMIMDARGQSRMVVDSVDQSLESIQQGIVGVLKAITGLDGSAASLLQTAQ